MDYHRILDLYPERITRQSEVGEVTLTCNARCASEGGRLSPAAVEAAGMSRHGKRKSPQKPSGPRQNSVFLIWITANRRSWTASVHPSPSGAIDTPLMNLFSGTAPSARFCRLTLSLPTDVLQKSPRTVVANQVFREVVELWHY